MSQDEKIFAEGFIFKKNEKAPEFVVGRMSIKVDDAISFLKQHQKNGWTNLSIKQARSGNYYIELDTYEPKTDDSSRSKYQNQQPSTDVENNDLPF